MTTDLHDRLRRLQAEVDTLRGELDRAAERAPSRRHLLRAAAAGAVGVAAGAAALGRPASAATGGNLVLGQANKAEAVTSLENDGPFPDLNGPAPVALELRSPGAHLRFVGAPGDALLGTRADGTLAYNSTQGLWMQQGNDAVRVAAAGWSQLFVLPQPIRLYDSRTLHIGGTTRNGKLASGTERTLFAFMGDDDKTFDPPFAGFATSVMINLTITGTVGSGFLSVGNPGLNGKPATSNVNWSASGQTLANLAFATMFEGNITVFAGGGGSTDFVVDLLGFVG